jgi:hypothetical protein
MVSHACATVVEAGISNDLQSRQVCRSKVRAAQIQQPRPLVALLDDSASGAISSRPACRAKAGGGAMDAKHKAAKRGAVNLPRERRNRKPVGHRKLMEWYKMFRIRFSERIV